MRAILKLCHEHDLHVLLDMHGDMVGSANCGWGLPMWISQKAAANKIGKPLTTGFPYSLFDKFKIKQTHCGDNKTMWAAHAGDPNYNLLNSCCAELNHGGNNPALGWSESAQATMDFVIQEGPGRDAFARFWGLVATAVADCPAVIGMELFNEPMTIKRYCAAEPNPPNPHLQSRFPPVCPEGGTTSRHGAWRAKPSRP